MPVKGWVNFTIKEEVAKALIDFSEKTGESPASIVARITKNMEKLKLVEAIEKETISEALALSYFAFETFTEILKFMESDEPKIKELRQQNIETINQFIPILKVQQDRIERILDEISPKWRKIVNPFKKMSPRDYSKWLDNYEGVGLDFSLLYAQIDIALRQTVIDHVLDLYSQLRNKGLPIMDFEDSIMQMIALIDKLKKDRADW